MADLNNMFYLFAILTTILTKINDLVLSYSSITLKVKRIGYSKIFNNLHPNETYINGIIQDNIQTKYNFNLTINDIELIWYNELKSCNEMFNDCSKII